MTTESPNIATATGTVGFNRKVSVRQYESAEASIFIQFDIPSDPDMTDEARTEQILANARGAFFQAKALVFEELGLEFEVTEGGVIRETLTKTFGNVTEVRPQAAPAQNPAASELRAAVAGDGPPFSPETNDKAEKRANQDWAKALYQTDPGAFFDNRPKKAAGEYKANAPDLKHKDTKIGVWLS